MDRLPKQFWRVSVIDTDKITVYARGSKTYAAEGHAKKSVEDFARKGIRAEIYTTGPVTWEKVSPPQPVDLGMEPMF